MGYPHDFGNFHEKCVPHIPMDYQWNINGLSWIIIIFSTKMPIWAVSKSQNWLSCWLSSLFRHPFAACVLTGRERSKVHNFYKSFPKSFLKLLNLSGPFPMSEFFPGVLDASKGTLLWRLKRFCTRSKSNSQTQRTARDSRDRPSWVQLPQDGHRSCVIWHWNA